MDILIVIGVIAFLVSMAKNARKVINERPGTSGPRSADRPVQPRRTFGGPQPEVWRQLGEMLERMGDPTVTPQPSQPVPQSAPVQTDEGAADEEGQGDAEGKPDEEGGWDESSTPTSAPAPQVVVPAAISASPEAASDAAPQTRPMVTAEALRRAVVMAEILNRPTRGVRRWQPK